LARNPATGVRLPKRVEREMLFLDTGQVEQLADAIGPHYRVLVYFLAYTGLRFGEVAALRVKRLDLLRGCCEVVESATEVGSMLVWGPTKTDERRIVRLPRFMVELLAEHLAGRPNGPDDLVFTAPQGALCATGSSCTASSSRPPAGLACPRRCAPTTSGIQRRACSSARAPASRQSSGRLATSRR
jgi:integrase